MALSRSGGGPAAPRAVFISLGTTILAISHTFPNVLVTTKHLCGLRHLCSLPMQKRMTSTTTVARTCLAMKSQCANFIDCGSLTKCSTQCFAAPAGHG